MPRSRRDTRPRPLSFHLCRACGRASTYLVNRAAMPALSSSVSGGTFIRLTICSAVSSLATKFLHVLSPPLHVSNVGQPITGRAQLLQMHSRLSACLGIRLQICSASAAIAHDPSLLALRCWAQWVSAESAMEVRIHTAVLTGVTAV